MEKMTEMMAEKKIRGRGKFEVCHRVSRKGVLCPLLFLILIAAAFVPCVQAQVPEQVDPFYLKLFEDGKYFYQNGDFAGAVSNFEIAFFGFVDNPSRLLECYIYLEACYAEIKNAEKTKYYYDEIKRLKLQTHLSSLKLPEGLLDKYLQVNAAFARLEAKPAGGSGGTASKTGPKQKTKPQSQPPASSSKKEADSKKAEDLSEKPAKQPAQTTISPARPVSPSDALATEIKQFRDSIKKDKRNPEPYFHLSALYLDRQKYKDARVTLASLLAVNPKNGRAHLELGRIYLAEGKRSRALASFEKAAPLLPVNPAPHYERGKLYFDQQNYDKARQSFALVQQIDKKYMDVERYMADLADIDALRIKDSQVYRQKARSELDANKKIDLYSEALKADPYNTDIYFEIKDVYVQQKRYKEAANLLGLLLKYYPDNVRIYADLGDVYLKDKAFDKAAKILERAIKVDEKNIELHYLLGRACLGLKKYSEAAAEFDIVLAAFPFYKDTRHLHNTCLEKAKK